MVVRICGLDCGRNTVVACVISNPIEDLKTFARSYKPSTFYAKREDLENLKELADIFVIEPTGADHRIFVDYLERAGKAVYVCQGERIRNHAIARGLTNKSDRSDAAAIADYGWCALRSDANMPNAFIDTRSGRLRDLWLASKSTDRASNPLKSQLWARVAFEVPELLTTSSGKPRKIPPREWGGSPGRLVRWIAGVSTYPRFEKIAADTVGSGLSELTKAIAKDIVSSSTRRQQIEIEIDQLIDEQVPQYCKDVFQEWDISANTKVALLIHILPFERFLGTDGNPIKEWVPSDNSKRGTTFRDRSLKAFTRSLGMGRRISESGRSKGQWAMCGSKSCRTALYMWIQSAVIFRVGTATPRKHLEETEEEFTAREKNHLKFKAWLEDVSFELRQRKVAAWDNPAIIAAVAERNKVVPKVAALQIYAQLSPTMSNAVKDQKIMKLAGRFCRLLYRDLLAAYRQECDRRDRGLTPPAPE